MECNCKDNDRAVIPWVRGNRLPLVICVYEDVVTQEGEGSLVHNKMERVPYEIQAADTVTVVMKSGFRQVEMPFTTEGNKVLVTDNGELAAGTYTVEVTIVRGDGARGRWQETRQVRVYENTSDAQLGEMYAIEADLFFYAKGDTGNGIADITANADDTLTITMTDGTTYTTQAMRGEKGDKGDTGERGVSIVSFDVTGQTDVSVIYTVTYSDGTTQEVAVPKGPQGDTGLTGNGIASTTLNNDYTLTVNYTDGTSYTTPSIRGAQGVQGVSVIGFTQTGETETNTVYNLVFSDGRTQSVAIPKGAKGDKGDTGNTGPQGSQGPKGDTVTATDYTLYNVQGSDSQGAMSQDATTKAISAQTGYYTCGTAAGTPEKVVTVESGNLYKRTLGGHFKVKMTNANTASGVTLQVGSETAAALWYNGAAASADNSWDAGEVISVYYDGTYYQASNAQGGGGKADLRNIGLLNVYFDGIGTTYATSDKFYVVAGHILKFTLVEQNVPYDSIASAQSRFMIYSHDANDVETTLYRVNGTNLPDKEIVVYVPDDSVCLYIGGRCSRGYKYECKVVDITCEYENTIITENDLYYHLASLAGSPEYKYRINILLPYQNNAVVKIRPKISTPTYQYEIDGVVIKNDKTTTSTILINYSNTQIDYMFKGGYSYIIVFFKKGDNLEVDKSELLSEYDINVEYPETIEELKITDGDKKWDLIGLSKISNNEAKTDFIVLPNLPMRVKMDIPIWMKVSFTTGNRTNRVYLGTYYSGDIVDFSQGSAGVFVDFKRLDNRGFDADFYTRHSKFLGMSLTQIGSNDGNIFERNFDNEKNLGGIMATGPQSIQRFPTIVHVSDAHGDSFRLNAAHDYADYINADLVVNTGDNAFYTLSDGVNFVKDIVFSHKADFANCIGNHDQYTSTLADVFSLNISPFATEYGYHKSTASDITDKCYYFKDLSAQKIRLIVLDVYDGLAYQAYKARISQEQINWFVSTLAATPLDYGVIVVSHQAPHTINAISGKANFNDVTMEPQINALDSDYMRNGKITGNPLGKIIDAFIVKGSVSGSYTQKKATSSASETISYSADFSNVASGVEFIAYINGHTHRDFIGYVADCENNQLNCNVCSTSPLSQTTGYGDNSDIYRDANGVAQDAFNVYTIDRYNHRLGVCRIGSNLSLNLIDRKVLWFSYV